MPDRIDLPRPLNPQQIQERRRGFLRLMLFLGFVFTCVLVFQAVQYYRWHQNTVGDGRTVESYGFDISNLTVHREQLAASGFPKEIGRLTLNNPPAVPLADVDAHNEKLRTRGRWGRIVVDSDVVLGVAVNGEARAYPQRYIQWHMLINDTLGGVPIAVTYDPLCVSAVVFDRRVGGETLELGFSGLVYNSNLVLYDKRANTKDESLWCQLTFGPIAGPAVTRGDRLTVLPLYVGKFEGWRKLHPSTSVFAGDERLKDKYKDNFQWYYQDAKTLYPVSPVVPADAPHKPFEAMMATLTAEGWAVRPHAPSESTEPPTDQPSVLSLWFAWHAIRGGDSPGSPPK